jgi:superfamily I DNA/RNA helicase
MARQLSAQQTAAVRFVTESSQNLVLEAVAGAGKTTTLVEMVKATEGSVAFCAFNKSISLEISDKISTLNLGDRVKVGTLHSFGFGAIRRAVSRVKVDGNKLRELARREFNGEHEILRQFATSAAGMAKECGIGATCENNVDNWSAMLVHHNLLDSLPDGVSEQAGIDAAQYLLNVSNSLTAIVDFSDMIYLPILNKMKIWQYDNVLLDEAQDTNATRRALVKMMLKPGTGRLFAVGDPCQAIYGFTGADSAALDNIRVEFNAQTLPLTVTYRCPKAIVSVANQWVDHIQAHESAPEGIVDACELREVAKLATAQDAVICRNTKPLVELAYNLIRNSVACRVEGRSIGEGLIKLAERWKTAKTVGELQAKIEAWAETEIAKHKAKGNDSRCQVVEDQAETLGVFIMQCEDSDPISVLVGKIRSLFGDTEAGQQKVLTLSTIHKAKGREWDRVFVLGMDRYSPSKWARQAWELVQEDNLCYVQVTRAKSHLTLVNVPAKVS